MGGVSSTQDSTESSFSELSISDLNVSPLPSAQASKLPSASPVAPRDASSSSSLISKKAFSLLRQRLRNKILYSNSENNNTISVSDDLNPNDRSIAIEKEKQLIADPRGSNGGSDKDSKVLVLGAGNFGTCLADHLADLGNHTTIWARDAAVVDFINQNHRNPKYLTDMTLSPNLKATSKLDETILNDVDVIIFSIPTQHMRSILEKVIF